MRGLSIVPFIVNDDLTNGQHAAPRKGCSNLVHGQHTALFSRDWWNQQVLLDKHALHCLGHHSLEPSLIYRRLIR